MTKQEDVSKAFDEVKTEKSRAEEVKKRKLEAAKLKKEAEDVLSYVINLLSGGVILVRIKNPVRKEGYAKFGRIIGVATNFHLQQMKVVVAYDKGTHIKIKGKKTYVPFTDTMFLSNIHIVQIVEPKPKIKEDGEKSVPDQ